MPTLRIIYDRPGWAFHNRALALQKYAPPDFSVSIAPCGEQKDFEVILGQSPVDVLFLLPQLHAGQIKNELHRRRWHTKVVRSSNQGWPYWVSVFFDSYCDSDRVIVNNREYWEKTGRLQGTVPISNGVDLEVFRKTVPFEERSPKVLWTGSWIARERKSYSSLFLPLQDELRKVDIASECLLVDSLSGEKFTREQMAQWYNSGTVYVCTSKSEGTPNPCLEAAACGCTVVSTRVGNMPELLVDGCNGYLVDHNLESIFAATQAACENYVSLAQQMQKDIQKWNWKERSEAFYNVFRDVLRSEVSTSSTGSSARLASLKELGPPQPTTLRPSPDKKQYDLSDEVTVFVSTIGAPSLEACLACLAAQDCQFRFQIVDHVAPMSETFQCMLDDCSTTYFIQVDEDMLLFPHAVRTLHRLLSTSTNCAAIANLYDTHLGRRVHGVKIFRHDIVRDYPFENIESCEKLQMRKLAADGHTILASATGVSPNSGDDVLGLHGVYWTSTSIYERYYTLEQKRKTYPKELRWFEEYHAIFFKRVEEYPSKLDFFALMGALIGRLHKPGQPRGEKDFRKYSSLPGLHSAETLWREIRNTATERVSETHLESRHSSDLGKDDHRNTVDEPD